jgi:hypothetical protein
MATRTAPRRKAPTRSVNLGGGLSLSLQRKAKRAVKRNTAHSAEWRVAKYVGTRVWRGGRWLAVRGATGIASHATAAGGHAAQWGRDKARFGLTTPLVRVTTFDADDHATTQRIPRDQMRARAAVLLGEADEPQFRLSGDRVRADEPRSPVWAAATRTDRQEVATGATAQQEDEVSEIGEGLEAIDQYEIDSPHDLPDLYVEVNRFLHDVAERLSHLVEDNQAHKVSADVLNHLGAAAEGVYNAAVSMEAAKDQLQEDLERVPTYGSRAA